MKAMLFPLLCIAPLQDDQGPESVLPERIRTGHWIEVRGQLDEDGVFIAGKAEILVPQDVETLIGTVAEASSGSFVLLGQPVRTSNKTQWRNLDPENIVGQRVKVEGHWRGPRNLSARTVAPRGEGRDRIAGRVDSVRKVGDGYEARIMRFQVFFPLDVEVGHERPLADIPLAPARVPGTTAEVDEDDYFGKGVALTDQLTLGVQITGRAIREDNYNLNDDDDEDRDDTNLAIRARLIWEPNDRFAGVIEGRHVFERIDDEDERDIDTDNRTTLGQTFLYWRDLFAATDIQVGRQDFDERREWIYDQNLDGVRLITSSASFRLETSISTTLSDGSDRDEETVNLIGYLSNNDDRKHLAAWCVYRDIDEEPDEELLLGGVRVLGEWIPDNDVWLELAGVTGERDDTDLESWGYDVGTTWTPDFAAPFSFTVGYAYGKGDRDPDGSKDTSFRQTGLQDNNAKFAGVTSFKYYGEIVEPELSNLGILTLGIGARIAKRTSLDLVFHDYTQDRAQPFLRDSNLDRRPDGVDADIGWELDLVFGWRRFEHWDLEIIGGWFNPGDAFTEDDDAYLGQIQLRYRL